MEQRHKTHKVRHFVVGFLIWALVGGLVIGCAPAITPIPSTVTSLPSSTPTITFTPTLTFTPSPSPSPTASFVVKRLSLKEFFPDLLFEFPITFEIPQEYVVFSIPSDYGAYYWMPQTDGDLFQQTETNPRDTGFFRVKLSLNVGYDSQTDRFMNSPNDMSDTDLIQEIESQGIKVYRIERKNIAEYPLLIMEIEVPYADTTRLVNFAYMATLVDTNVLWISYYHTLPTDPKKDREVWDHFETSLERIP